MRSFAENHKVLLVFSSVVGSMLISIKLFYYIMINYLTVVVTFLIEIGVYTFFAASIIFSLILVLKKRNLANTIPFLIHVITLISLTVMPLNKIALKIEFMTYQTEREGIILQIQQGELDSSNSSNFITELPPQNRHLSKGGGEILVNESKTAFFFYTFRGLLDRFNGFYYSSDDSIVQLTELIEEYEAIEKIAPKWYWISS